MKNNSPIKKLVYKIVFISFLLPNLFILLGWIFFDNSDYIFLFILIAGLWIYISGKILVKKILSYNNAILSVSEPWDFESEDGKNLVNGRVLKILSTECIIFRARHTLNFDKQTGNILVLTPRHVGYHFSNELESNASIPFNGSILLTAYSDDLTESDLLSNSEFVIVGSFQFTSSVFSG